MPETRIEEFDAVTITGASIQFFENGTQQEGTKFGCMGSITGETEMRDIVKNCEGVESKKISKPVRMNNTVNAHIPIQVARDFFGLSNKDLKPGVWAYGTLSKGKKFIFTADVIDEFEDIVKLIAFVNCTNATGFRIQIENGSEEVAQLELEFSVLPDELKNFYYEALVNDLGDETVAKQWHKQFTTDLVKSDGTGGGVEG
ncbi:hypothetical protein J14TS2_17220 [Bacillus sp. J14TS2]|uniref:phage tail protein n=1 Tax=Bacillus sp. J14TS2 TaxID=2807188 RepID=UPI001B2E3F74|nr:phage tail protein [Bacillus sp. J14TS2]GIN71247.1 hypothetical protein J14TS2_17220 [Bacillus sp. J14TS2]